MVTRSDLDKILSKYGKSHYDDPLVVNGITYDSADEYTQIKRAEAAKKKEEEEKQNKTLSARLDKQSEKYRSKYASPLKGEDLERFMVKDDQNPLGFEEMQELGGFRTNQYNKWTDPYRDRINAGYVVGKTRLGLSQGLSGAEDAARVALANFVEGSTDTTGEMLQKDINNFGWDENKTFGGNLMANTGNAIKTAVDFANMWSRPLTRGIADNAAKVFGKGKSTEEFTRDLADKITSGNIISNLTRLDEREDALSKEAENHGKITQLAGEVGQAVGGMTPALATAAVTKNPNLALGIVSASAGGSQAREALESGATIDQAYNTLITTATKEALVEKIAGGIPALGSGAVDKVLGKITGDRGVVKLISDSLGEGAEEILSNYLQDYINEGTFDSEEERATFAELLYSGGVGAAVSAILRVPVAFSNGHLVLRDTGEGTGTKTNAQDKKSEDLLTDKSQEQEIEEYYSELERIGQAEQSLTEDYDFMQTDEEGLLYQEYERLSSEIKNIEERGVYTEEDSINLEQLEKKKRDIENKISGLYMTPEGIERLNRDSAAKEEEKINQYYEEIIQREKEENARVEEKYAKYDYIANEQNLYDRFYEAKNKLSSLEKSPIPKNQKARKYRHNEIVQLREEIKMIERLIADRYNNVESDSQNTVKQEKTSSPIIKDEKIPEYDTLTENKTLNLQSTKPSNYLLELVSQLKSKGITADRAQLILKTNGIDAKTSKDVVDYVYSQKEIIEPKKNKIGNKKNGKMGKGSSLYVQEQNNFSSSQKTTPEHLLSVAEVIKEQGGTENSVREVLTANGTDQETIDAVISTVFGVQPSVQTPAATNRNSSLGRTTVPTNQNEVKEGVPFDAGNKVERGLASTLNANPQGTVGQEALNLVNESPNRYYNPVSLEQTQQQAAEALSLYEKDSDAVDALVDKAGEAGSLTSREVGAIIALINKYSDAKDYAMAAKLVDTLMTTATDMGRAINALKLISKRSPEGLLAWANRQISAMNRKTNKEVSLTEQDVTDLTVLGEMIQKNTLDIDISKTSNDFQKWIGKLEKLLDNGRIEKAGTTLEEVLNNKAVSIVAEKRPSTLIEKFRALQRTALLMLPKTHERNILGNLSELTTMETLSPLTALFDKILSKYTGKRAKEGLNTAKFKDFFSGAKEGVNRSTVESVLGLDLTGNRKFDKTGIRRKNKHFNENINTGIKVIDVAFSNVNKLLNALDKAVTTGLNYGDSWALYGQYRAALGEIMRLNNMTEENVSAEAVDAAWQVAFRRTFRDDNALTKAMSKLGDALHIAGAIQHPFVKTVTNALKIAMEYSPIGVVEGLYKAFYGSKSLKNLIKIGGPTMSIQREIAELLSKGFVGTAIAIMGFLSYMSGDVTGDESGISDEERAWNKAKGKYRSSIKIGDVYVNPSSLQSLSTPYMAGASYAEKLSEEGEEVRKIPTLTDLFNITLNMGNTALEMPVLQGAQDLFNGQYDDLTIGVVLSSLAANAMSQIIPGTTVLSAFAKTFDPYARVTSVTDKTGPAKILNEGVNELKAKIPGLRETLPIKYDVLGNPIYNDAGGENLAARAFNQFVNPFITSASKENEVTEEIDRLYAETKDTSILPSSVSKSFSYNGERQKLNAEELSQWQKTQGETTSDIIMNALENPQYNTMTDEQKKKLVSDAEEYAREKAKEEHLASQGIKYVRSSSAKWADKIDDLEKQGIDNSKAIFYRAALSGMETTEERAEYLMNDTSLSEAEKTAIYDAFGGVSGGYTDIIDEINFNDENDFMVSLTGSNSATNKYNSWFSSGWSINGHSYDAIDGNMYYDLYKAYNSGSNVDERVNAIAQTLVNDYGFSEAYAEQFATDFRKKYAKTLK